MTDYTFNRKPIKNYIFNGHLFGKGPWPWYLAIPLQLLLLISSILVLFNIGIGADIVYNWRIILGILLLFVPTAWWVAVIMNYYRDDINRLEQRIIKLKSPNGHHTDEEQDWFNGPYTYERDEKENRDKVFLNGILSSPLMLPYGSSYGKEVSSLVNKVIKKYKC